MKTITALERKMLKDAFSRHRRAFENFLRSDIRQGSESFDVLLKGLLRNVDLFQTLIESLFNRIDQLELAAAMAKEIDPTLIETKEKVH